MYSWWELFSTSHIGNLKFAAAVFICIYCFCCSHFKYRGVYPVWAGLTASSAHSRGLCCVTRLLRRAKDSQEKLKFWDGGIWLCADLWSPWWHFSSTSWGCTGGLPRAWHPWRYVLRVAGGKQAIIHTFLLVGIMACCRNLQEWALGDMFPSCGFCTGWKYILKCCTSTPAFFMCWRCVMWDEGFCLALRLAVHDLFWFGFAYWFRQDRSHDL